ncbi:MAG: glycosyltransferase [Acidimicrobiia bacterium]
MADSSTGRTRVTLGITTEHGPACLRRAIDSVRAQTVTEWELYIFDDGEDDSAAAVVEGYGDPRLRRHRGTPPAGYGAALGALLGAGEAPFVTLLSDLDELRPDHLRRTCTLLEAYPRAVLAHSAYELAGREGDAERGNDPIDEPIDDVRAPRRTVVLDGIDRALEEPGRRFRQRALDDPPRAWLGTALLRRERLTGIDPTAPDASDLLFLLRASCRGTIAYDPVPTVVLHRDGRGGRDGFITVDDGASAPTITTVRRRRVACRATLAAEAMTHLDRLRLRTAEVANAHRLLTAVLRRRWREEPTVNERLAVARQALAVDRSLAFDARIWWELARTVRRRGDRDDTVIDLRNGPGDGPHRGGRSTAAGGSGRTVARTAWAQAQLDAAAAEEAAIAVAERLLLAPKA